jgi:ligand-binding sensor domain-containing protein
MTLRPIFLVTLALALLAGCSSSEDPVEAPPPTWESYYGACRVTAVALEDPTGLIFAGTHSQGFRYFDGSIWFHYLRENSSILSNEIRDVALDAGGYLWIATARGISLFDGSGFASFTNFSTVGGLPSDDVRSLFLDGTGYMWVGTSAGAARYTGSSWDVFTTASGLASNTVLSVGQDAGSDFWFGHDGAGLTRMSSLITTIYSAPAHLSNGTVRAIAFDGSGTGWFATDGGLNTFDGFAFSVYTAAGSNLPSDTVRDVVVDPADTVWIATNAGFASLASGFWNVYTTSSGLYSDDTYCCAAVTSSAAWVGTDKGVCRRNTSGWSGNFLGNSPLPSRTINDVTTDAQGRMWYATAYGVARQDGTVGSYWDPDNTPALSGPACQAVLVDAGGVAFIGTLSGLNAFNGTGWDLYTTVNGLPGDQVTGIAQDTTGDLWLATWDGVSCFDRVGSFQNYGTAEGLPSEAVRSVAVDAADHVWASTAAGLARYDGISWTVYTVAGDGLPSNDIRGVAFGPSLTWVATSGGLACYDGSTFVIHDVASGALPSDDCRGVGVASNGDVFAATAAGLAVRVADAWSVRTTANSPLLQNDLNTVYVVPGLDAVYIGTAAAGLSIYRPEHLFSGQD